MPDPRNIVEWVGIIGALLMLCVIAALVLWPVVKPLIGRKWAWFWIAVIVATAYAGTKPPTPPGSSIEKINTIIDAVSSTSVTVHWEYLDIDPDSLQGKRVRVLVNNKKMNGWQTVFEGDAATDTSCTFAGFYIADDTKVQVQVDNAIMAVKVSFN